MLRLSACLLFPLTATLTFAQAPDDIAANAKLIAPHVSLSSAGCPVSFAANRQANTNLMSVDRDAKPGDGPAQGLHLLLDHLNKPAIQSIEVTVYGTSLKTRALLVGQPSDDTVSKTFEFHRTAGSDSLRDADVWMHQVGSLSWVDLISITFTDRTTWHPMADVKCRAVPSNFLLVGSK